jgi:hypothetical protein
MPRLSFRRRDDVRSDESLDFYDILRRDINAVMRRCEHREWWSALRKRVARVAANHERLSCRQRFDAVDVGDNRRTAGGPSRIEGAAEHSGFRFGPQADR